MRFEDALSICYENETHAMIDQIYDTREQLVYCPICTEGHMESDKCWNLPHECAEHMPVDEGYVCSPSCATEWLERHWKEIEEYHLLRA